MISPGLQVDAGKEREEKIHSKRENVSIQSFSINEAEDFLKTSMKLNQTPTYRRGDKQLLCVFTAYSVFRGGTGILSRMRKVHLNKAGRAQNSSKPTEKLKTYFSHQQEISPYLHRIFCSLGIIFGWEAEFNLLPQIWVLIARSKESKAEGMRGIRFRVKKFWYCFPTGGRAAKTMVTFEMQLNLYTLVWATGSLLLLHPCVPSTLLYGEGMAVRVAASHKKVPLGEAGLKGKYLPRYQKIVLLCARLHQRETCWRDLSPRITLSK